MAPKIIVGFDATASARDALALAERFAVAYAAELVIATVRSHEEWERPETEEPRSLERWVEDAAEEGRALVTHDRCRPVVVTASSPAHGLHDAAEQEGAMLVVVGSTHRGAIGRITLGSTAQRLLSGTSCPVAVAPAALADRPGGAALEVIGAGYDGSTESRHALIAAEELARRTGARLRVIAGVTALGAASTVGVGRGPVPRAPSDVERMAAMREQVDRALAGLDPAIEARAHVELGLPADVLVGQSHGLDLLICGSRGYGRVRQVLLGGVSASVAAHARCPVLLIPRGVRTLDEAVAGAEREDDGAVALAG